MANPIIVIAGPTAVGKTKLSLQIAQKVNGEIINGDSLQFYRGLDIGTGKIQDHEMEGIPHHLLNFLEADASYDVSYFVDDASHVIQEIRRRHHIPIIVGGSGLYIEGLLYEMSFGHEDSHDNQVRDSFNTLHEQIGDQALWQKLSMIDPKAAEKIPYQNYRRVIRALEVYEVTGKRFSDQFEQSKQKHRHVRFEAVTFIFDRPRNVLYERINQRVEDMVDSGLETEVSTLYQDYQQQNLQSLKAIGYKEWFPYFAGESTRDQVISTIQRNSRRYAKRQLTWFRNRLEDTHWIDVSDEQRALKTILNIINEHMTFDENN